MEAILALLDKLGGLADQAFKSGPFLYAMLFSVFVSALILWFYRDACSRKDPPISQEEQATYRRFLLASTAFGIICSVVSIYWWFTHQPTAYIFRGVIQNLGEYESVGSTKLYFRKELKEKLNAQLPQFRDQHFVYVKEKPFRPDEVLDLSYAKDPQDPNESGPSDVFELRYMDSDEEEVRYVIGWNDQTRSNVLRNLSKPKEKAFVDAAYASGTPSRLNSIVKAASGVFNIADPPVALLEFSRTPVRDKIQALNILLQNGPSAIKSYIEIPSPEPHVLTLLDLTRHTDRELASKAQQVISHYDITSFIADLFFSSDTLILQSAEAMVFRIEPHIAIAVLDRVARRNRSQLPKEYVDRLLREVKSGKKTQLIVPTGRKMGDVYYVQFAWNHSKPEIPECLAKFLYSTIEHSPNISSPDQYLAELANAQTYWVYAREKFQALRIRELAEKCGATASLVGYDERKVLND